MSLQPYRAPQQHRRNDACYCGSGVKYKKCHLIKQEAPVEHSQPVNVRSKGEVLALALMLATI